MFVDSFSRKNWQLVKNTYHEHSEPMTNPTSISTQINMYVNYKPVCRSQRLHFTLNWQCCSSSWSCLLSWSGKNFTFSHIRFFCLNRNVFWPVQERRRVGDSKNDVKFEGLENLARVSSAREILFCSISVWV